MKIDKAYYLIICSRGPGSETITVEEVLMPGQVSDPGSESEDYNFTQKEVRQAEKALEKAPVVEVNCFFNDEGPVIALRKGAKLKDIWKWLEKEVAREEDDDDKLNTFVGKVKGKKDGLEDFQKMFDTIRKEKTKRRGAYLSACLRAFIIHLRPEGEGSKCGPGGGGWTSCNSWRDGNDGKVSEALTEKQYKMVLSCGITLKELEQWDCRVMRDAFKT